MSGTSYLLNRTVAGEYEDLKNLQAQRTKLEKAAFDYKNTTFQMDTLTDENRKLKAEIQNETNEKHKLETKSVKELDNIVAEIALLNNELLISRQELEKYQLYSEELEKNNCNWKQECELQSTKIEELVEIAEEANKKLHIAEEEYEGRKKDLITAKTSRHTFLEHKSSLDRHRHNHLLLEQDLSSLTQQNRELEAYIEGIQHDRVAQNSVLTKLEKENEALQESIARETLALEDELTGQKKIVSRQTDYIQDMRAEIDRLRKDNLQLKGLLDI